MSAADTADSNDAPLSADDINRSCVYIGVQHDRLREALDAAASENGFYDRLVSTHPNLFSDVAVFASHAQASQMQRLIDAVESVIAMPAYQDAIAAWAPANASAAFGPHGAFLGYDFHLTPNGPQLIEINTNAGGALLNAILARAHRACCAPLAPYVETIPATTPEHAFLDMFANEWRLQRGAAPLRSVAIVDEAPDQQYLAPEFQLFQRLFQTAGIDAVIADAGALRYDGERLWHGEQAIDLIYNRLTDFALTQAKHTALQDAYLAGHVVVTPHPRAHALYADKRNLSLLTDRALLQTWGVPDDTIDVLINGIPQTTRVASDQREKFWAERRRLFFKPVAGFGGRATYRGDKLTRGTFEEILRNDYVAQAEVAPSERRTRTPAGTLKLDVRCYTYDGKIQLYAARLYRGQTTNFRTPGGGFAPVYVLPDTFSGTPADVGACLGGTCGDS